MDPDLFPLWADSLDPLPDGRPNVQGFDLPLLLLDMIHAVVCHFCSQGQISIRLYFKA